jgi:hypothetical protein
MATLLECLKPLHFASKISSTDGGMSHSHRRQSLNKYSVISCIKYVRYTLVRKVTFHNFTKHKTVHAKGKDIYFYNLNKIQNIKPQVLIYT